MVNVNIGLIDNRYALNFKKIKIIKFKKMTPAKELLLLLL